MGRRKIPFTQDSVVRAIRAVKQSGIEIRSVRIESDGAVVINGDCIDSDDALMHAELVSRPKPYL
ncbi:hypothetical protein [Affinirhizobium pseudoryzae]|uniref:hypothetical protein n=1 Tax=Allorhizobium pseudoryzae TaxID=379684 RepID=UPI0013ED8265|nr:hypothetical protein [Allorhizobium pseudoryzae]